MTCEGTVYIYNLKSNGLLSISSEHTSSFLKRLVYLYMVCNWKTGKFILTKMMKYDDNVNHTQPTMSDKINVTTNLGVVYVSYPSTCVTY